MGCYAHFYTSNFEKPNYAVEEEDICLLAKYRKPILNKGWETPFGLAGIHHKKLNQTEYWNLAGSGEGEVAPWED